MRRTLSSLKSVFPAKSSLFLAVGSLLLAGCSSSIDRFADYPGKKSTPSHTASYQSSADDSVESAPLGGTASRTAQSSPYQAPVYGKPWTYQGGSQPAYQQRTAAYEPNDYSEPTYSEPSTDEPSRPRGGTVRVEPGQTLYSIARANGIAVGTLASVNGIRAPYTVRVGQKLLIPGVDEPRAEAAYAPANKNFSQRQGIHTVRPGETLYSLGRKYGVHPYEIADLNDLPNDVSLNIGQRVRVPGAAPERTARTEESDYDTSGSEPTIDEETTSKVDRGYDKEQGRITNDEQYADDQGGYGDDTETNVARDDSEPSGKSYVEKQDMTAEPAAPTFRWPVKGRILSRYGSKPGGTRNEGINIAVPEGTSIRAAEDGVVAYAGNELKGYGNLVLIRHQGGWVTAYAHNRDLFVRRGDTVRRGDVIAKAGQTGSVESPQLHFELRKGATAVDPMKYLSRSQTASN